MNILLFLTPKNQVAYVFENNSLRQVLEKMQYHNYTAVPVIDKEGRYICTVTEGDLLWEIKDKYSLNFKDAEDIKLSRIKKRFKISPVTIHTTMDDLVKKSLHQNFVPVVDDRGVFIGIITRKAIIQYLYDRIDQKKEVKYG